MSLETHQFDETNLTHSCSSSAGSHHSKPVVVWPQGRSLAKPLGERLAWGTARKPVMWTEPPLSAPQSERAQRAWLSKQHPAPSELRSCHNTERYRPGKHPPNQTKVPCPREKQQKVRRHRPDLAFPRVSPSSALHPEQGQVTFYCRWLGDMNRKLDWLQNTET